MLEERRDSLDGKRAQEGVTRLLTHSDDNLFLACEVSVDRTRRQT